MVKKVSAYGPRAGGRVVQAVTEEKLKSPVSLLAACVRT